MAEAATDRTCSKGVPAPARSVSGIVRPGEESADGKVRTGEPQDQAEFQARKKKLSEGWADFADDLQSLVEKAYPTLQHEARELLAINAYLRQVTQPQEAFSVKQKNPGTLDDTVAATLEMESYTESPTNRTGAVSILQPENETATVAAIGPVEKLTRMVERLSEQVEMLQLQASRMRRQPADGGCDRRPKDREQAGAGESKVQAAAEGV